MVHRVSRCLGVVFAMLVFLVGRCQIPMSIGWMLNVSLSFQLQIVFANALGWADMIWENVVVRHDGREGQGYSLHDFVVVMALLSGESVEVWCKIQVPDTSFLISRTQASQGKTFQRLCHRLVRERQTVRRQRCRADCFGRSTSFCDHSMDESVVEPAAAQLRHAESSTGGSLWPSSPVSISSWSGRVFLHVRFGDGCSLFHCFMQDDVELRKWKHRNALNSPTPEC